MKRMFALFFAVMIAISMGTVAEELFTFQGIPLLGISEEDVLLELSQKTENNVELGEPFVYNIYDQKADLSIIPISENGYLLGGGIKKNMNMLDAFKCIEDLARGFKLDYGTPDHQVFAFGRRKSDDENVKEWTDTLDLIKVQRIEEDISARSILSLMDGDEDNDYVIYVGLWNNVMMSFAVSNLADAKLTEDGEVYLDCSMAFSCFNFYDNIKLKNSNIYYLFERSQEKYG